MWGDNENHVSIKEHFRRKNKKKMLQDPTNGFSIIPSWNEEFVCLIGLEDVVRFRLEQLDETVNTSPNQHGTKGRQKKIPIPSVAVPATLRKDPYTCAKCNTDVSCSWKRDVDSSIQCQTCLKSSWRKDNWPSSKPPDAVFNVLQSSSQLIYQHCDQQVPKNSSSLSSKLHPDSPCYCSSPLSSDASSSSSSPPEFYSDASSHCSSSFSSDHYFLGSLISSSSCGSSLCDDSSPSYLPFSSDLYFSSSSMTPPSSVTPPIKSALCISQKVETPYWMENPPAKDLLKDNKVEQETKKEKKVQLTRNRAQCKKGTTEKMATIGGPSNRQILPKTPSALPDPVLSSPLFSITKHQFQTTMLTPNLQNKLTMEEELKPGNCNLQKVTLDVTGGYVSSAISGSSTFTSGSGKLKSTIHYLPTTWLTVSGNTNQQASTSIPRSFDGDKKVSDIKNETRMQHQVNQARPSSSLISSASTHMSVSSQTALPTSKGKVNQKIDKWLQMQKTSLGFHGSCSFRSSSSSSSAGQPKK